MLFIFFQACERAESSKSCNLIGSVSGRYFTNLPANSRGRHKNEREQKKESSKCHNVNYRAKIHVVMFCFGLQSIARFIQHKRVLLQHT